mmetsp:Transcript_20949/g.48666  ORF Transcript_20949/g.48666 Transcript_20949/m.48666 type:complete len:201 (-) Transcript_20949:12-614(-)
MMSALYLCGSEPPPPVPPQPDENLLVLLNKELGRWRFPIFKFCKVLDARPLVVMGGLAVAPAIQKLTLCQRHAQRFFDCIESRYRDNPYHNSTHGADILNNMLYFLRLRNTPFSHLEPVECLAALVAAGAHDVGHPGLANPFHKASETPLARLYNDQSPLENMHCTITFSVLQVQKRPSISSWYHLTLSFRSRFRSLHTL